MNKTIKAVIIEDEVPAARLLCSMVSQLRPEWDVVVLPGNIEEAVAWFTTNAHPDLIFLDIQLSDGNSFEFISQAKPSSAIIFTTAYDQYAIRAFSVNSIDYILKPIDRQRLSDAVSKYETITNSSMNGRSDDYLDAIMDTLRNRDTKRFRTRFLIAGVDRFWTLQVNDVAYFYSENKITYAVTKQGEQCVVDMPLTRLVEELDSDHFFRANRQVLLSVGSIVHIEPYFNGKIAVTVKPAFKSKITISEEKISVFKMWLNY